MVWIENNSRNGCNSLSYRTKAIAFLFDTGNYPNKERSPTLSFSPQQIEKEKNEMSCGNLGTSIFYIKPKENIFFLLRAKRALWKKQVTDRLLCARNKLSALDVIGTCLPISTGSCMRAHGSIWKEDRETIQEFSFDVVSCFILFHDKRLPLYQHHRSVDVWW